MRVRWRITRWFGALGLVVSIGGGALALLPVWLTATTAPDPGAAAPPSEPSPYDPEVQKLLETTYLGHAAGIPDPGEPAAVLQKYLEQNAHGYHALLAADSKKLDAEVAVWEDLTNQYPQSRHAYVGLAKHYRTKALATGDIQYTRQAADAYLQAAALAMAHGRIRYTRELSTFFVELGDREGLDETLGRMLAQPKDMDRDFYYLALVDYADGLARLSDDRAWGYFEEAIDFHPGNNLEAINRYATHLLDRGHARKAFEILDTQLTFDQRVKYVLPAQLRKQAMEILGIDTSSADTELALIEQRKQQGGWSLAPAPSPDGAGADTEESEGMSTSPSNNEPTVKALSDSRVSTIFGVGTSANMVRQDAIFSPNGAMNNRWPNMLPTVTANQLATLKWPGNTAGLARIGTDNRVYYRYFNGSSWNSWAGLSVLPNNHSAVDIAAVVYANNQADIFAVANDHCTIYSSRSTNKVNWGAWQWWGACGDNITAAIMPDGTGFAAIRATGAGNQAAVRYFNGSAWAGSWTGIGGIVNDLALLAYTNPSQVGGIRMGLSAVGSDNCTVYGNNWNGSSWSGWAPVTSCFDKVAAFNTRDGGAYVLFIHRDTDYLYTLRFTGSAWAGLVSHPQGGAWIEAAGANIDDETWNAYEHTEANDDCRVKHYSSGPICNSYGTCVWTQGVNLAEIIYNEARGETPGAQDTVGWVVRDRAFQEFNPQCDHYPGQNTICATPCNDPERCNPPYNAQRYCCAMHGGQTQLGTSGYQFNDEHVHINELTISGVLEEAIYVGSGWVPDPSTGWCPPGIIGCNAVCQGPGSQDGDNYDSPSPNGPMEFRNFAYTPTFSSCKQVSGFICPNSSPNNYFWNRR